MTRGLESVFGLPSMDEIIAETELSDGIEDEMITPTVPAKVEDDNQLIGKALEQINGHAKAMDAIYADTLKHAIDTAELAFDLDPARAPRMLEVSAIHYKTAMDAQNSKIDATMKMMKLVNDTKKLDMDNKRLSHELGDLESNNADVVLVEDRNELLRRLRDEANTGK